MTGGKHACSLYIENFVLNKSSVVTGETIDVDKTKMKITLIWGGMVCMADYVRH